MTRRVTVSTRAFDLEVAPAPFPWMHPDAVLAANFEEGEYWLDAVGGPLSASSLISTTRSSGIILPNAAGDFQSLGNNTLPRTDRGLYANGQFVQSAANWNAPANETVTLGTGTFTLAVWGSGSATVAAGTAAGTGFGPASAASPVTFTLSGAGTVSLTVTGSPSHVSLTNTGFAPPAPQPPGTILASDIRAVQGVRTSNGQAEPFPGWEAAGLDDGFTVLMEYWYGGWPGAARTMWQLAGDSSNVARLYTASSSSLSAVVNSSSAASAWRTPPPVGRTRTAVAVDWDTIRIAQAGSGTVGSAACPPAFEARTLRAGQFNGGQFWNDWIYELQICSPLSNAELLAWVNA